MVTSGTGVYVEIEHEGVETGVYRCLVTVDEEASDSKLVYAEAVDYQVTISNLQYLNGAAYLIDTPLQPDNLLITNTLTVEWVGDSAEPLLEGEIRYNLKWERSGQVEVVEKDYANGANLPRSAPSKIVKLAKELSVTSTSTATPTTVTLRLPAEQDLYVVYEKCANGFYYNLEREACETCVIGYRDGSTDQMRGCLACSEPALCPDNINNRSGCRARVAGEYTMEGKMPCAMCPSGTFATPVRESRTHYTCELCAVNTASVSGADTSCAPCDNDAGFYTPAAGFSECIKCSGSINKASTTDQEGNAILSFHCSACESGQGVWGDDTSCRDCVAGYYSKGGACIQCGAGTYTDTAGLNSCVSCSVGTYQNEIGTTECKGCFAETNQFSVTERAATCSTVQSGYQVVEEGLSHLGVAEDICPVGTYGSNGDCVGCVAASGDYQDTAGQVTCNTVAFGQKITADTHARGIAVVVCSKGTVRGQTQADDDIYTECYTCDVVKGEYQDQTGRDVCKMVEEGDKLDAADPALAPTSCPAGTARSTEFFVEDSNNQYTECKACSAEEGQYQTITGQSECSIVNDGYIIDTDKPRDEPTICGPGTARSKDPGYFVKGSQYTVCRICFKEDGEYQNVGGKGRCKTVDDGYYIAVDAAVEQLPCPAGTARSSTFQNDSPDQYTGCKACSAVEGQYQTSTGKTECSIVTDGYYVDDPSAAPKSCPAGTARSSTFQNDSPNQYTRCKACSAVEGQYEPLAGQTECSLVDDGYYVAVDAAVEQLPCPAGMARSSTFHSDPPNKYTECKKCSEDEGQYQTSTGKAECSIVTDGYYIDDPAAAPKSCSAGTARSSTFQNYYPIQYTGCKECSAAEGQYQKLTGKAECSIVNDGYYVDDPSAAPTSCSAGTARSSTFQNDSPDQYTECKACSAEKGQYQKLTGQSECSIVNDGYYITSDAATIQTECQPGTARSSTFSIDDDVSKMYTECKGCSKELGQYQTLTGKAECSIVNDGYYIASDAATIQTECQPGTARSSTFSIDDDVRKMYTECKECSKELGQYQEHQGKERCSDVEDGYFIETDKATSQTACPVGTARSTSKGFYLENAKYTECRPCPEDKYQNEVGKDTCKDIPEGKFRTTADKEPALCAAGTFGMNGACIDCVPSEGKYQTNRGMSYCSSIKPGFQKPETGAQEPVACAKGTVSNALFECVPCYPERGEYKMHTESSWCSVVTEGNYIDDSTAAPTSCPAGTARSSTFQNDSPNQYTECKQCSAVEGQYQKLTGKAECSIVNDGYYVDDPAAAPISCPAGTARSSTFHKDSPNQYTECKACSADAGQYQKLTGQAGCSIVNDGYYIASDAATTQTDCQPGTARSSTFNIDDDVSKMYTECKECSKELGQYQEHQGKERCSDVDDGYFIETDKATSQTPCPVGTARSTSKGFYLENAKYTECKPCPEDKYQNEVGKDMCKDIPEGKYRTTADKEPALCGAGTFGMNGACHTCYPSKGKYQTNAGMSYCSSIRPGFQKPENGDMEPAACAKGTFSNHLFECVPCVGERGEYQTEEERSFCKVADPGHELRRKEDGSYDVESKPVKCEIGTYSKGSAPTCSKCDRDKKEYQNDEGATYCKICARGRVSENADYCEGLGCPAENITMIALRETPFFFSETAAGETLIIPCDPEKLANTADKVYRVCKYDEAGNSAAWDLPRFGRCPTAKTEAIMEMQSKISAVNDVSAEDLAATVEDLALGMNAIISTDSANKTDGDVPVQLTERDISEQTNNMKSLKGVVNRKVDDTDVSPEEKKKIKAGMTSLRTSMAETFTAVAKSDKDTLATVDTKEKTEMLDICDVVAGSMEDSDPPIITAVVSFSRVLLTNKNKRQGSSGEGSTDQTEIALPTPADMPENEAPTLSLGDMVPRGASVVVISRNASDSMFPASMEEEEVVEGTTRRRRRRSTDSAGTTTAAGASTTNHTISSCVVSLTFDSTPQKRGGEQEDDSVEIILALKADVSGDADYIAGNKALERVCSYLDLETNAWSTVGCVTTVVDEASGSYECKCDHTTSFAILLSISDIEDKTQEHVSLIMFWINITFLLLTFLAIAPFKKYRKRRLVVLQTQLVLALIVGNIAFQVLGEVEIFKVKVNFIDSYPTFPLNVGCYVGVMVVQYLFLVAMAWMTCCAYTLYSKICNALKTFGKADRFYIEKCVLVCWGLPVLIPTSSFLVAKMSNTGIDIETDRPYIRSEKNTNGTDCWVADPWRWTSFMMPMYLCLLLNFTVFIMIVRVLIRAAKSGSGSTGLGKQIKGAVTIAITVGVPWIIGVMTFEPIAVVGQWSFIILTGLQGPVMFVCFVLLQEEVLGTLLIPCGVQVPEWLKVPAKSTASCRSKGRESTASAAFSSTVVDRNKDNNDRKISEVAARKLSTTTEATEPDKNVYSNEQAIKVEEADEVESQGTKSDIVLVPKELPEVVPTPVISRAPSIKSTTGNEAEGDHVYYECTHFPYDPERASLASTYPEPVTS